MGTLFNVITVIVGSCIGLLVRKRLSKRFIDVVFAGLGLFTIFLGISMALKSEEMLLMIFALVIGGLLGEAIQVEQSLNRLSDLLKKRINSSNSQFTEGLTTAFMLFCVGSLTILGAFEEGLGNKPNLLITKGVMDGFSSIALSTAFGVGVLFSAIPLLLYQGGLTLFASFLAPVLSNAIITELSAVGGVMIIGIGINILEIKKLPVVNMLPALLLSPLLVWLFANVI